MHYAAAAVPSLRKNSLAYRPDVDGLRAVAVLLVVFDHIRTRLTTGGYIGVDVFFVISGYLISSVILTDMTAGRFSIAAFYERRVRRILPALLAMLLGSAVLTWFYFVPSETEAFARSMLAALFSASNFLFWHQAGYFDAPSALKPLLHTWSLAVEEQFYIFFPLFLIAVRRWFPNRLRAAIWSITVITFVLACVCVRRDPTTAFYFAPLRAWELLIGAIVSQRYVPAIEGKWPRNMASAAGLLLILLPAMLYTAKTPFPGLAALPPCAGAALLIAAGESGGSVIGRVLSWRPIVFIGLISYSLYLWHWPILVFLEKNYVSLSSATLKAAVVAASLAAAILSWYFVETPFRSGPLRPQRRALFAISGGAAAVIAALGVFMIASGGFPVRFSAEALAVDRYTDFDPSAAFRKNVCFIDPVTTFGGSTFADYNKAVCLAEDPARRQYLLIGDSHAAHLYPGLVAVFPELNISQATAPGCGPFLNQPVDRENSYCIAMYDYIFGDYLIHHHVDTVLIGGRWLESYFPKLERTIEWIRQHGMKVVLFGPGIEFDVPLPRLLTVSLRDGNSAVVDRHRRSDPPKLDAKLAEVARTQWKVPYISVYENMCAAGSVGCPAYAAPGVPLLFDANHFTPAGSTLFAKTIRARHQLP